MRLEADALFPLNSEVSKEAPARFGNFADRGFRQAARRCRVEFVGYPQKPWTLVHVPKREARRGAPGFKDRFRNARQRAGAGDTGGMSLRRARTEPSCVNKVPQQKLG